jgi:predicted nucleic acid-binding protein
LSLFVDTSVWSLVFRRDATPSDQEAVALIEAIERGESILATGLVLQELLQGFFGPRNRAQLIDRFSDIPLLNADRADHIGAAELRNRCRRSGVQIGTIDALIAQLCIRHDLTLLTTDTDFRRLAAHSELRLWRRS